MGGAVAERAAVDMTQPDSTSSRILVIEDDRNLAAILRYNLEKQGYTVSLAYDGLEGLKLARATQPDLVILDLMLPSLDGREVCRYLHRSINTPILILTALDEEEEVVAGLEAGADDYVTKPFSMRELLARVAAHLRRVRDDRDAPDVIVADQLLIKAEEQRAFYAGRELWLPPKQFSLLLMLARHPGKVFSRRELLDRVWGEDIVVDPRNVDVHIRLIRAQLEGDPDGSWLIRTVHGVGYRFVGESGPPAGSTVHEGTDG